MKLEDGPPNASTPCLKTRLKRVSVRVEQAAFELATGKAKRVLEYQGKITYKQDRRLGCMGYPEDETYILDENGDRIPETVPIIDPEMIRWLLERLKPEIYGKRAKAPKEPQRTGGVLVVENPMSREEYEKRFGGPQPIVDVEFEGLPPPKEKN